MALIKPLTRAGKKVALILSFPQYPYNIHTYLARQLLAGRTATVLLSRTSAAEQSDDVNAMLKRVAAQTGATTWDPADVLCPSGPCVYQRQMLTYYKDTGHLTKEGSRTLLLPMIQALADRLR